MPAGHEPLSNQRLRPASQEEDLDAQTHLAKGSLAKAWASSSRRSWRAIQDPVPHPLPMWEAFLGPSPHPFGRVL